MVAYRLATLALSVYGAVAQNTVECGNFDSVTPPGASYQSKISCIIQRFEDFIDFSLQFRMTPGMQPLMVLHVSQYHQTLMHSMLLGNGLLERTTLILSRISTFCQVLFPCHFQISLQWCLTRHGSWILLPGLAM
jgi:hypothetical protein